MTAKAADYDDVQDEDYGAEVDVGVLPAHELGHDVDAARGVARAVDEAEAQAVDDAAVDGREQQIVRDRDGDEGENVHQHRGEHRRHEGADDELQSEGAPGQDEQRDVYHDVDDADGDLRQVVDYHRDTGDAAGDDVVGVVEKPKAGRVDDGAYHYQGVFLQIVLERLRVQHIIPPTEKAVFLPCPRPGAARRRREGCGRGSGRGS